MSFEQARKLGAELPDGKRSVGAEFRHGALDAGPRPVPDLALGIAWPNEQHEARVGFASQHGNAVGLVETRQEVEIGVLPPLVLHVVVAQRKRRREEHDGARAKVRKSALAPSLVVDCRHAGHSTRRRSGASWRERFRTPASRAPARFDDRFRER